MCSAQSPRFLDAGEAALVVEFGDTIDPVVHDQVLALDAGLTGQDIAGIVETVPTFRSVMIHYDPLLLSRQALIERVMSVSLVTPDAGADPQEWTVPCCYDPEFAEDLPYLAQQLGLSAERIVTLHAQAQYRLYMYGFVPGYCYLGGLPPELEIGRRAEPRPPTPENVVTIAAGMSSISTFSMPTGWWVLGRAAERMFSVGRTPQFFARVGDNIRFERVDTAEFRSLDERSRQGEIVARKRS